MFSCDLGIARFLFQKGHRFAALRFLVWIALEGHTELASEFLDAGVWTGTLRALWAWQGGIKKGRKLDGTNGFLRNSAVPAASCENLHLLIRMNAVSFRKCQDMGWPRHYRRVYWTKNALKWSILTTLVKMTSFRTGFLAFARPKKGPNGPFRAILAR